MPAACTLTIREAAEQIGAPMAVIRRVADDVGLLIYFGRSPRIDPNDLGEIIDLCRSKPKARASTAAKTQVSGLSATAGESVQQAHEIAQKLKKHSPATSQNGTGQVVPLSQGK